MTANSAGISCVADYNPWFDYTCSTGSNSQFYVVLATDTTLCTGNFILKKDNVHLHILDAYTMMQELLQLLLTMDVNFLILPLCIFS